MTIHCGRSIRFFLHALGVVCVICGLARAQSESPEVRPLTLNRKAAASLILAQSKPDYPPLAKVNYIQGKVRLQVLVSPEGKVMRANVVTGHPFLAAAALKAVRRWLYSPFKTDRGPVPFVTLVDVDFALRNVKLDRLPPEPDEYLRRQIRPPSVVTPPSTSSVLRHLRILVSDDGQPLDVNPVDGFPYQYDTVLKQVEQCRFQPAHWGPLAVPWYLDVNVPVDLPPAPKETVASR